MKNILRFLLLSIFPVVGFLWILKNPYFDAVNTVGIGIVFVVLFALLVRISTINQSKRYWEEHKALWEQQALKRKGHLHKQRLIIDAENTQVTVYMSKQYEDAWGIFFNYHLNEFQEKALSIVSSSTKIKKSEQRLELQTQNPLFDNFFFVEMEEEDLEFFKYFLSPKIQEAFLKMRDVGPTCFVIGAGQEYSDCPIPGEIELSILRLPRDEQEFDEFIENGLVILRRLKTIAGVS